MPRTLVDPIRRVRQLRGARGRALAIGGVPYVMFVRLCSRADSKIISAFAQCDSEHGEEGWQRQRPEAEMDFEGGPGRAAGHEPDDAREGQAGPAPDYRRSLSVLRSSTMYAMEARMPLPQRTGAKSESSSPRQLGSVNVPSPIHACSIFRSRGTFSTSSWIAGSFCLAAASRGKCSKLTIARCVKSDGSVTGSSKVTSASASR